MTRRLHTTILLLTLLSGAVGCGDDLPRITDIVDTRIIGARTEVVGAPERAAPRPGESADVTFAVVSPEGQVPGRRLRSLLIDCTYPRMFTGIPLCQEFIDLAVDADPNAPPPPPEALEPVRCAGDDTVTIEGVQGTCVFGDPVVRLNIPEDYDASRRLVRGIVCDRGTPFADVTLPELFGCDLREGGKAILVHGSVRVALDAAADNDNPDLAALELTLNGRPWDALPADALPPEDGCRDAVDARRLLAIDPFEHTLGVSLSAADREIVDGVPEDLELQLYASAGAVGRRFTVFEGADPGVDGLLTAEVPWMAPPETELPEGGQLVRLYLTALDQRGGFDMAIRHACVYSEDPL